MRHQWSTYGPVSPIPMLGKRVVMLLGADACQIAFTNREKAFANGPGWTAIIGPFFHRGLMLLDFEEHHMHRRIMQGAFTRPRLESYVAQMHPAITEGTASWGTEPGFKVYPALKQLTLDIAARVFMGGAEDTSREEMDRVNEAFITCVQTAAGIIRYDVPFTRWGRGYRARKVLEDFLRHYLPSRRARKSEDLFSQLCHIQSEDGETFSDEDIVNHMIFLMMAAHDTSTITLTTMFQYLGQYPNWQQRCREESEALGPQPDLDQLEALASLDLVMRECLRLRAPVPVVMRHTVKDTEVLGVRIPARTRVIVAPQWAHLQEEYWTNPLSFDPERFAEPRREDKSHRYAWEPFGGGVHKCIGMFFGGAEVKAVMHHALRNHRWRVDPNYIPPIDNKSLPFPSDGQPVNLVRRFRVTTQS